MISRNNLFGIAVGFLIMGACLANAASREPTLRVTILSAETHQTTLGPDEGPRDCDLANYSGYCHGTRTQSVQNVMLVEESDGKSLRVMCTVDTRWSKCDTLPVGSTFDARRVKQGLTIYFLSEKGKPQKQLYTIVASKKEVNPAAVASILQPVKSPVAEVAQPVVPQATRENLPETVKCSFSSIPEGAEITVDGRYSGNTPSVLGLTSGTHVVVLIAPGFSQWKKELAVSPGSEVTVHANLEQSQ
jgi:PEGA domain-containing protein